MSDFIFIFMLWVWVTWICVCYFHTWTQFNLQLSFILYPGWWELQSVRDQLFFSGFSSEVKPLSSQRTGSEAHNNLQDSAVKELLDLQQSSTCGLETLRSVDVGVSPRCFHQYFTKHSQYHRTVQGVLPSRICGYQVNFRFSFFSPTKLVHFLTR